MSSSRLFTNLSMFETPLENLLKHRFLGSPPLVCDPVVLSWSLRICFLTSRQGMLTLPAQPYLENLCLNLSASSGKSQKPPGWGLSPWSISGKRDVRAKAGWDFRRHPYCWGQEQLPQTFTRYSREDVKYKEEKNGWVLSQKVAAR